MIDGKRLKLLRKEHGFSAKELGKKLGFSETTVYRWEKDDSLCDFETIKKLADLYNVSVSYLLHQNIETEAAFTLEETEENEAQNADQTTETEETAPVEIIAETQENTAKKQLSLVKIGAITAASTFMLFGLITAIIVLCEYFQHNDFDGSTNATSYNYLDLVIIVGTVVSSIIVATTATVLIFYFIRKRRR